MILTLLSMIAAVVCYSIRESYYHGKLKWQDEKKPFGFWGESSDYRKYKMEDGHTFPPKDNWYYRFNDLSHEERFPLAGSFLVFVTDGVHMLQALMFVFLSLSVTFALGFDWYLLVGVWIGIHLIHSAVLKLLKRKTAHGEH